MTIVSETGNSTTSNPSKDAGTTRWMSPELLDPCHLAFKDGQRTIASDCYALGMVIFEVLSGQAPFARYNRFMVPQKVTGGERPERPESRWFTDDLWNVLELCWSPQPVDRPTVGTVFEFLERVSPTWDPLLPGGRDAEIGARDESSLTVRGPGTCFPTSR